MLNPGTIPVLYAVSEVPTAYDTVMVTDCVSKISRTLRAIQIDSHSQREDSRGH